MPNLVTPKIDDTFAFRPVHTSKHCNQIIGRNFQDNLTKFVTNIYLGLKATIVFTIYKL